MADAAVDNSWECPACTYRNIGSRSRCEMCDTQRPGGTAAAVPTAAVAPDAAAVVGAVPAGADAPPADADTWVCTTCTLINNNTDTHCAACGAAKPVAADAPHDEHGIVAPPPADAVGAADAGAGDAGAGDAGAAVDANVYLVVPERRMNRTDHVICNANFDVGQKIRDGRSLLCSNYRKILRRRPGEEEPSIVRYKVSAIQLNEDGSVYDFARIIRNYCDAGVPAGVRVDNNDEIVYYKGAYVLYDLKNMRRTVENGADANAAMETFNTENPGIINIYKNAAKPILAQSLLLLKRMGYKTVVVDPEPGFHPRTVGRTPAQQRDGLVRLYQSIGLHPLQCSGTSIGLGNLLKFGEAPDRADVAALGIPPAPIMVGDIDTMINRIDWRGILGGICQFIPGARGRQVSQCRQMLNVPAKVTADIGDMQDMYEDEAFDILVDDLPNLNTAAAGGGDKYYGKYLKYKTKYLKLRSKLGNKQ